MIVDKVKNAKFINKPQTTFHHLKIVEKLLGVYMPLTKAYYNFLPNSRYNCYIIADLKYDYLLVLVHFENC